MLHVRLSRQRGDFRLDVTFSAQTPGIIALFGRSGSGKTTLAQLIAGLLPADEGAIQLNGQWLYDSERALVVAPEARRIGYVFQDGRLFPHFTVHGNLLYGWKRRPPDESTDAGLPTRLIMLLGLEKLLARRPWQLSGGERQRVALGRALLAHPRLLLLDEPLAALDQRRREEVLPYLERVRDELRVPMIYVSHQFDEVLRLATHVVLMDQGRSVASGDLPAVSLHPQMRDIIGVEALGAVVEATVAQAADESGLGQLAVGRGRLQVPIEGLQPGQPVRLQLLARDLILALGTPRGLSVRNRLAGIIVDMRDDDVHSVLVSVDVGGPILLARVTALSASEMELRIGLPLWVLVKSVTLRTFVSGAE
jgi:molybdate transport system ATP-binding protein